MPSSDPGHIGGPVVIPNCVQVGLVWTLPDGRQAHNVLHGQVAGGFNPTQAIANAVHTALSTGGDWTALADLLHTGTSLDAVTLTDMRVASAPTIQSNTASAAGTSTELPLAPSTALVVTFRTAQAGRGFRGRAYIPGWSSEAMTAAQIASGTALTVLGAWASGIAGALSASGITFAIAQPARAAYTGSTGTAHGARAAGTVPITSAVVRNALWDTQRRRGGRT